MRIRIWGIFRIGAMRCIVGASPRYMGELTWIFMGRYGLCVVLNDGICVG